MFNADNFIASLENLDNIPCNLSCDEIEALSAFAKRGDSELEYILDCAFALGFERGYAHV